MKAAVVYESIFGNTKTIAQSIAKGLSETGDTELICVAQSDTQLPADVDLLVVGGPTHGWGMSRPSTRRSAPQSASKPNSGLVLEPGADTAPGVREWLAALPELTIAAAAFDTRVKGPWLLTGRASRSIAKVLADQGAHLVDAPESFLVDRTTHLLPGEEARAEAWARHLAEVVAGTASASRG